QDGIAACPACTTCRPAIQYGCGSISAFALCPVCRVDPLGCRRARPHLATLGESLAGPWSGRAGWLWGPSRRLAFTRGYRRVRAPVTLGALRGGAGHCDDGYTAGLVSGLSGVDGQAGFCLGREPRLSRYYRDLEYDRFAGTYGSCTCG